MIIRFKSCPRCKGDVVVDKDQNGWYEQCLQCGHLCELETHIVAVRQHNNSVKQKRTAECTSGAGWSTTP